MNMLTSLKALLFSSTTGRSAVQGTAPASDAGAPDFAAMLSGSMTEADIVEGAVSPDKLTGVDHAVLQGEHDAAPRGLAIGAAADAPLPPGLALGLIKHGAGPQPLQSGSAVNPAEQVPEPSSPADVEKSENSAPLGETASPEPQLAEQQASDTITVDSSRTSPKPCPGHPTVDQLRSSAKKAVAHEIDTSAESAEAQPVVEDEEPPKATEDSPVLTASPALLTVIGQATPPAPAPMTAPPPGGNEGAKPPSQAASNVDAIKTQAQQQAAKADIAPAPPGTDAPTGDGAAGVSMAGGDKPVEAPVLHGKPMKAEAVDLLQLVREQVAARQSGASTRVGEQVAAVASKKGEDAQAIPNMTSDLSVPATPDMQPQAPVAASQPSPSPIAPPVDLSASLGAQVVDMGVSGQWIDGLARDIAGLSANGAQGRFQINADHLGAVQVDIRHGTDGAAVSLTVANEAAELALRQDSDRLKLDAGLAAVRIAEVRVERAAPVAETHRADMGQQPSQQQGPQPGSPWQNNSQNMGQPQGQQGRWQPRENNGFGSKSSNDPAVLNHAQAPQGGSDAVRARYA